MEKKYKLTDETIKLWGHTLHRIEALKDFGNVKKGDLGGWIEKEENLSQEGDCWVYENAKVDRNAKIYDNAVVYGNSEVNGNAEIYEEAKIYGDAFIIEDAKIYGESQIHDRAMIGKNAQVYGNADVYGTARIFGNALISKNGDYLIFLAPWATLPYSFLTWTKSNNMWAIGLFYGTGKSLISYGYKDNIECGKNYEDYVKFVENLNK